MCRREAHEHMPFRRHFLQLDERAGILGLEVTAKGHISL